MGHVADPGLAASQRVSDRYRGKIPHPAKGSFNFIKVYGLKGEPTKFAI
jgi:hypothetical protein